MAFNNNLLFAAALAGFASGNAEGGGIVSPTATDYAPLVNAGVKFATQADSLIPTDASISNAGGAATASAATDNVAIYKVNLMTAICRGYWAGRKTLDTTQSDYAQAAAACVALFTQVLASFVIP